MLSYPKEQCLFWKFSGSPTGLYVRVLSIWSWIRTICGKIFTRKTLSTWKNPVFCLHLINIRKFNSYSIENAGVFYYKDQPVNTASEKITVCSENHSKHLRWFGNIQIFLDVIEVVRYRCYCALKGWLNVRLSLLKLCPTQNNFRHKL